MIQIRCTVLYDHSRRVSDLRQFVGQNLIDIVITFLIYIDIDLIKLTDQKRCDYKTPLKKASYDKAQ